MPVAGEVNDWIRCSDRHAGVAVQPPADPASSTVERSIRKHPHLAFDDDHRSGEKMLSVLWIGGDVALDVRSIGILDAYLTSVQKFDPRARGLRDKRLGDAQNNDRQ